ncbi:hypothetical protein [Nocardioides jensenii]|uniref:hypothetical protein n=1 Tax=Nocardioides jensenii TaxID=1843 RepID=UPI0012FC07C1|nr:hypothetical protein [Nocardioides jensenii]
MSETQPGGLLVRAKRLTSLARQAREGAEAVQDHTRTETALAKLDSSLRELETAVRLQSKLVEKGVAAQTEFDLTKAPEELKKHIVTVGRPSPQLLQARANDAGKAVRALSDAASSAWSSWAQSQLDELPVDRLARLGFERKGVELRLESMRRIATAPPTPDSVDAFTSSFDTVASRLAKVEPEGPLDALLAKLPCHLDELTDDELRMLRDDHADIAAQIVLRVE